MPAFVGPILNVLMVVLGVGLLIFVHELGHFIFAKLGKVRVETFSLGMGPRILGFRKGETDYRLSLIPLGGYVKMAGEPLGERSGAPDELMSKPAWTRFKIFAAGSVMNFIVGFPLCMIMYMTGVNEQAPYVGYVMPGSAEWDADIQIGDRIVDVNGTPIESLDNYHWSVLAAKVGSPLTVTVVRGNERKTTTVKAGGSEKFGVRPFTNVIAGFNSKGSPAKDGGMRIGDEVLEIAGQPIAGAEEMVRAVRKCAGQTLDVRVRHRDGTVEVLKITPKADEKEWSEIEVDDVLAPIVGSVRPGSPAAAAGIIEHDRIAAINGKPMRAFRDMTQIVQASDGVALAFELKRGDQTVGVTVTPRAEPGRRAAVGVIAADSAELGEVRPGSPFAKAGLQEGDTLVKAGGKDVNKMLSSVLEAVLNADGKPVEVEYSRGGQVLKTNLAADRVKYASLGVALQSRKVTMRFGFVESVSRGFMKTKDIIYLTFLFMKKLAVGEESTKGVAGPVGIFHSSYLMAEEGTGNFLFWLALITINLGIFNLLVPVPILDGGHIVFLIIEKIRGKPVSDTVMMYSQYAGLILLLGLVILVTGNDIMRFFR